MIQMKRHILLPATALMMAVAAGGCSDDLTEFNGSQAPEGCIRFSVALPAPVSVSTRAVDDETVGSLTVLLYDEDGTLIQTVSTGEDALKADGDNTYTLSLNEKAKATPRLRLHLVANPTSSVEALKEDSPLSDLEKLTENSLTYSTVSLPDYLVMAGHTGVLPQASLASGNTTVPLYRNAAKSTVRIDKDKVDNFEIVSFKYCNMSQYGYVLPFGEDADGGRVNRFTGNNSFIGNNGAHSNGPDDTAWFYPTSNSGSSNDNHPYLLVEGIYTPPVQSEETAADNATTWYKLELVKRSVDNASNDNNSTANRLDIQANHHYDVVIQKVTAKGYASEAEAARGEAANLISDGDMSVDIYDEEDAVLSMVADATHELGVSARIEYEGDAANEAAFITVKVFSEKDDEEATAPELDLSDCPSWLYIGEAEGPLAPTSSNDSGRLYRFPVTFVAGTALGRQTATIPVSWCGLTRSVEIVWTRQFNPTSVCSAALTAYDAGGARQYDSPSTTDYWNLLANAYGVSEGANGPEMARDEGFHFPMPYGDRVDEGRYWTYEYDLTFGTTDRSVTDVELEVVASYSDAVIRDNLSWTVNGNKVKLTFDSDNAGYNYGTGILKATLHYADGKQEAYTFNIYHTGFLHYDEKQLHREDGKAEPGVYYYEVVEMGGNHWLDRNLGAKSRGMDIIDGESHLVDTPALDSADPLSKWPFTTDAGGGYYKVADYSEKANLESSAYTDICPPGYHVPVVDEWLNVRSNLRMTTTINGGVAYVSAEYVQDENTPHAHTIYFPKMRYLNNGAYAGESRSGYYWTATQATGMEKDQIGNWFKSLYIAGASTSYVFGSLQHFLMPVRAVAGNTIPKPQNYTIALSTQYVTHVYLYTVDANGNRQGLMNWPGQVISTDANTSDTKWANFTYTTTINPEETPIGIIFNYLASNGRIVTMGAGPDDRTPNDTYPIEMKIADQTRTTARGWRYTPDIKGGQFRFKFGGSPTTDIVYYIHRQPSNVQFMDN